MPILPTVETPDRHDPAPPHGARPSAYARSGWWAASDRILWVSAIVLAISAFTDWYAGSGEGVKLAVIGWHTGALGKLVFFAGFALVVLLALREVGIELPPSIPESLVVVALGVLATVFVAVRLVHVPESVLPADSRGIGIWISLLSALGVVLAGVLRTADEL
jgi:hypothetical protein